MSRMKPTDGTRQRQVGRERVVEIPRHCARRMRDKRFESKRVGRGAHAPAWALAVCATETRLEIMLASWQKSAGWVLRVLGHDRHWGVLRKRRDG